MVIPTYNCAKTIGLTLQSLFSLNYPRELYEVVIVDGGSTDGTPAEAAKYRVRVIVEEGASANRARNLGANASKGEILAFTDGDCLIPPDWLIKIAHNLQSSGFDCVGGMVEAANSRRFLARYLDRSYLNAFPTASRFSVLNDLKPFSYLAACNMAIKRQAFLKIGGFDEEYRGGYDDLDFLAKALKAGCKVAYDPQVVVHHYHRERLKDALRQVYWYGTGLARFRFKHPRLKLVSLLLLGVTALTAWLTFVLASLAYFLLTGIDWYLRIILLVAAIGYVALAAGYAVRVRGVVAALTYPILDLLRGMAFSAGAARGFLSSFSKRQA